MGHLKGCHKSLGSYFNPFHRAAHPLSVGYPRKFLRNQPTTAQRWRSETEKNILEHLFCSVLSQFKKCHPSGNLKHNNLVVFQSLKLRILREKS